MLAQRALNTHLRPFLALRVVAATAVPGETTGLPPRYRFAYLGNRLFQSPSANPVTVSFEWDITDDNGGLVPVPSSLTVSLLDSSGNALSPVVTSTPPFDNNSIPALIQTVGGLLTLPTPTAPSQVYYVQLYVVLDKGDGTGVQRIATETVIRIMA